MKIKFKAIRFLPNRSQLSFFAKWLTKEVTAGLVVAAAIALATLWINNYQARQKEKLQLEKLHLGLSSQYIDRQYEMTPSLVKRGFTCHT